MIKVGMCQWQNPTIHEKNIIGSIYVSMYFIQQRTASECTYFQIETLEGGWHFKKSRKSIINFLGAQIISVAKINFGIYFQFLSLQSKTNVLSVGNNNCKRQHTSYGLKWIKILNQEIIVKAQPIRFQWERQRAEKNQTNATNVLMPHITRAIWGNISKYMVEKRQTNATSVIMHPIVLDIWGNI